LTDYVMRFHRDAILISDLKDGVAYTVFLNGLLSRRFKFSHIEIKIITFPKALSKA